MDGDQRTGHFHPADRHVLGSCSDRDRLEALWKQCQAQFVDDPAGAVHEADRLVTDIMQTRGYSILNAEDRIAQISAAYPALAAGYRSACYVGAQYRSGNASRRPALPG